MTSLASCDLLSHTIMQNQQTIQQFVIAIKLHMIPFKNSFFKNCRVLFVNWVWNQIVNGIINQFVKFECFIIVRDMYFIHVHLLIFSCNGVLKLYSVYFDYYVLYVIFNTFSYLSYDFVIID